ncbi:MAG: CRP-like cAMP-binding protein [Dinoroseobacter sp.]|jgi:CRP-like cAMP-binding protein
MTSTVVIEIIGAIGLINYVLSYALLQLGIIRGNGYVYPAMNLMGAGFVAVSMLNSWNTWSALTSVAFTVFSVVGMTRVYLHSRKLKFDPRESSIYQQRFPLLSRRDMRKILSQGNWVDGEAGFVLTTQGQPVIDLRYVYSGGVDVLVGGQRIASIGSGELIGEMACMRSGPASATVVLNQPTEYFTVSTEVLNTITKGNVDLLAQLEFSFAGNVQSKLVATNARLEAMLRAQAEKAPKTEAAKTPA